MKWLELGDSTDLDEIFTSESIQAIFKHSTRCPVSYMAKRRFEDEWAKLPSTADVYLLDLIRNRKLSNEIEERTNVRHESPQLIILKGGRVVCHFSHSSIDIEKVLTHI